jgi:hypothetical protein
MYTFKVSAGNYTLTVTNPKGGAVRYAVVATTNAYTDINPIILP